MARTGIGETGPDRPRGLARIKAWARSSPWWAISIGLHLIVFLAATLVYIEKFLILDEGEIRMTMEHPGDRISDLERPPEDKEKPPTEETKAPEDKPSDMTQDSAQDEASAESESASEAFGPNDGKGKGLSNVMGVLSDSGTRPGGGIGGRRRPPRKAQKAEPGPGEGEIRAALQWLARHQNLDGSWSATRFSKNCGRFGYRDDCTENAFEGNQQYDVGVTALALLAFLGAGHSSADREPVFPESGLGDLGEALGEERTKALSYGEVVKRAIRSLIRAQSPSGMIGPEVDRAIYNHTISTLALAEAYGETGVAAIIEPVEKALRYLHGARSASGGWRYAAQAAESDASVTGWAVLAFHAAEVAGISVDGSAHDDLRRWFDRATVKATVDPRLLKGVNLTRKSTMLLTGYLGPKDAGKMVSVLGLNDTYGYTPALTATMVMATVILDGKPSAKAEGAAETLLTFLPPRWSPADKETWKAADFYYWFHATYALSQLAGTQDERWKRWCDGIKAALLDTQNLSRAKGECREGSWDPVDRWSCEGGRVYATAMAALTLEVRFRSSRALAFAKPARSIQLDLR